MSLTEKATRASEIIRLAAKTAKCVTENDGRFRGLTVALPSHVVFFRDKPRLITVSCIDANEKPFLAVFDKDLAKEIAGKILKYAEAIEELEAEEDKECTTAKHPS